jgi:uncharacterized protein YcnI
MRRVAPLLAAGALLAGAGPAAGHIDVLPATVTEGQAGELVVRVPNERDVATTRVAVEVPREMTVYALADPPPGWSVATRKGSDGRIRTVIWSGGRIGAGRYADFRMLGTAFATGDVAWPARQTYADGQVKPWTAAPEAEGEASAETGPTDPGPASAMTILSEGEAAAPAASAPSGGDDGSGAAIWLGVIAIGVSALSAVGVGLLWSTRPARLPRDEEAGT